VYTGDAVSHVGIFVPSCELLRVVDHILQELKLSVSDQIQTSPTPPPFPK
jgi:hypothetical protein